MELQLKIEKTIRRDGEAALTALDRTMISVLNKSSSQGVLTELLSEGLVKPMGRNCISLMTTTGAKGSKVVFCFLYISNFNMGIVARFIGVIYVCLCVWGQKELLCRNYLLVSVANI